MGISFDETDQECNHGSDSSLDDIDPCTAMFWFRYSSASGGNNWLYAKSGVSWGARITGSGLLNIRVSRSGGLMEAEASTGVAEDVWQFAALVYDTSTDTVEIYIGDEDTPATEVSYNVQNTGSGALTTNASQDLLISANVQNTLGGDVGVAIFEEAALTRGQIIARQFFPHATADTRLLTNYGFNSTGVQVDWSGNANNGTLSGTAGFSVAEHPPISFWPQAGSNLDALVTIPSAGFSITHIVGV